MRCPWSILSGVLSAPKVRFTKSGEQSLAYVTYGSGPNDIVFVSPVMSHVEVMVEPPQLAQIWSRLADMGRLILFDRRGAGLSDPAPGFDGASLYAWSDDLQAVLGAVNAEKVSLFTFDTGAPYSLVFAASHPERVRALALVQPVVPNAGSAGGEEAGKLIASLVDRSWGEGIVARLFSPAIDADPPSAAWWARFERMSMSRGTARQAMYDFSRLDVRSAVPLVQAPVLIMDSPTYATLQGSRGNTEQAAPWLEEHLTRVERMVVDHTDLHWWWQADLRPTMLDAVSTHFTGEPASPDVDRVLATVLFTDIVGSTQHAARTGDKRWTEVLRDHDELAGRELERHRGRRIKSTGDGILATFDGPARAIRFAQALRRGCNALGIETRAGVHTGEIERLADDIGGIAVHIGQRITTEAQPGEVLVSRTVVDLVVGSGIDFNERGEYELKGVPGSWRLFCVAGGEAGVAGLGGVGHSTAR
jgi:class 3 adenylate cyclase/pimeloyl-ACP methyl ester carboxylesterase